MARISCILYARSSKDGHDIAPATQLKELRAYAESKNYRVAAERKDAAVSANDDPPELAALLKELANPDRGWEVIVAIDSSRMARDVDLAGVISYNVRKAGCRIEYSKHPATDSPAMDMIRDSIMRGFDAYHSMVSKQKGLAGMRHNVAMGHRAGGRAPIGYKLQHETTGAIRQGEPVKKSKLVLDPETAPRVQRYLGLRSKGQPRQEAARRAGLTKVSPATLIGMERNAFAYAGITVWNRRAENGPHRYRPREEWVMKRDTHPALIDEKTAEALMVDAMPKTTRKPRCASGQFLLSGFLRTPHGLNMVASGDGSYRAGKGKRISAPLLEAVVCEQIQSEFNWYEFRDRFIAEARKAAKQLITSTDALKRERASIDKKLANLMKLAESAPDSPTVAARLRELESERERIEAAMEQTANNSAIKAWLEKLTSTEARKYFNALVEDDAQTVEERRMALAAIVDYIEYDPDARTGRIMYRLPVLRANRFDVAEAKKEWYPRARKNRGVLVASPGGFEPPLPP